MNFSIKKHIWKKSGETNFSITFLLRTQLCISDGILDNAYPFNS